MVTRSFVYTFTATRKVAIGRCQDAEVRKMTEVCKGICFAEPPSLLQPLTLKKIYDLV